LHRTIRILKIPNQIEDGCGIAEITEDANALDLIYSYPIQDK
jgi:hypothetical protein